MRYLLTVCAMFVVGFLLGAFTWNREVPIKFPDKVVVTKPPYVYGLLQRLTVFSKHSNQTYRIVTDRGYPVIYGDVLSVDGTLSEHNIVYSPTISSDGSENEDVLIMAVMYSIRESIVSRLKVLFTEPFASLISGIVFGVELDLGLELKEEMRKAGITHILVASGYNVTFIVGGIISLLTVMSVPRRFVGLVSMCGVVVYAIVAGMEPPIVRAGIMVGAVVLAEASGRQYHPMLILSYTAMAMLLYDVKLYNSLSFFLSITATCAIFVVRPFIARFFTLWATFIRDDIVTTLSVILCTTPLVWLWIGNFQVNGLLTNVVILWVVPYVTWGTFIALVLSFISISIAQPIAYFVTMLLSYLLFIVEKLT